MFWVAPSATTFKVTLIFFILQCASSWHTNQQTVQGVKMKTTQDKTERIVSRISAELKEEFERCLVENDEKQSDILRKCVQNYVRATKRAK